MFPMTITINNHDQLNAVLSALGTPGVPGVEAAPAPTPEPAVKAAAAKKQKVEPAPEPAATPEPKAEPAPAAGEATYQDAAAAITKLSRLKGRETAVALLSEFGASKLPDVKPDQFADVIAKATALMGE